MRVPPITTKPFSTGPPPCALATQREGIHSTAVLAELAATYVGPSGALLAQQGVNENDERLVNHPGMSGGEDRVGTNSIREAGKPKFVEDILVAWRVHMPTCNPEIISQVRKETYAEPVGLSRSGHYPCLEAYLIIGTDGLLLDNNLVSYASIDDWKQQFLEWWDYLLNYKSEDEIPSVAAQSERRT
jgi:hypothetical protein